MELSPSDTARLVKAYPRRYALIEVKGITQLACFVNEEWIIDATCDSINEMLVNGLVCESSVNGWISSQYNASH